MALAGHVDEVSRSGVDGWAYDSERPEERVSVSVFVNGTQRGTCLAARPRDGLFLSAEEPAATDFAFHFTFDPPLSPFIVHRVEVREMWSAEPLANTPRIVPPPDHVIASPGLTPILLTSTGRAGTTMLMSEFACHDDIVVGDRYPYEIKQLVYHAVAFRALVADADRERSTTPETMLAPKLWHNVGANPFNTPGLFDLGTSGEHLKQHYHSVIPSRYAALFGTLIQEFYATLAAGQGKRSARFFCEKGDVHPVVLQAARLFRGPVKEIVLLRDPRDLFCSAMAFWKLPPEQAMVMLRATFSRLVRAARAAGPDTIVVRYEDLIRDPVFTRRAISDFLGVDLLSAAAPKAGAIESGHRTSANAAESIGRWRRELTPGQIGLCELAFGYGIREFDYEPTGPAGDEARDFVRRRMALDNQIVAAEGMIAVTTVLDENTAEIGEASRPRPVLDLTFGAHGGGGAFMLDGWWPPEEDFVWSRLHECGVMLPAIQREGDYRLRIVLTPFTHGNVLPAQRVTLLLDGEEIGTARLRQIAILSVAIPDSVATSGQKIALTFRFPDAAQPSQIGANEDGRMLGFALQRVTLLQTRMPSEAVEPGLGSPRRYVGAPNETPSGLAAEWHKGAAD